MFIKFFKEILGFSKTENIRILMYHHVQPENLNMTNDLTVTAENLEEQLQYIKKNYNTLFFKELENKKNLENKLILTFDDGFYNNLQYLLPLLEKYQLKATIFITTNFIQERYITHEKKFMSFEEIRLLNNQLIEIGLHSHSHKNYSEISTTEVKQDLLKNKEILKEYNINFSNILAYPYGKYPRQKQHKKVFFKMLEELGIIAALRIGNSIETYPWKNKFEVKRIDIKGGDSFKTFKLKLKLGKIKL